ncbi:MAG: GNAT family N-acetyltransferase [Alphaproteobacteria bacterium]|nr:GNAT family N-acetyltransferase [Alphaproteobacteria bacterium]
MTAGCSVAEAAPAPAHIATLAAAFHPDPALAWIMPDAADRRRRLPRFFDWLLGDHARHGHILASPGAEVVTLWRAPGKVHHHDPLTPAELWKMLGIFGPSILRAERAGRHVANHVPRGEDHLYLRYAGVRPDMQGKGWGGLAIRTGIALANSLGVDTCLETANPANVALYRALGFEIAAEWRVPRGPRFWTMRRPRG